MENGSITLSAIVYSLTSYIKVFPITATLLASLKTVTENTTPNFTDSMATNPITIFFIGSVVRGILCGITVYAAHSGILDYKRL